MTRGKSKRIAHKLTIYRRHASACLIANQPTKLDGCECPLWAHGSINGKRGRWNLDTRSVPTALEVKKKLLKGGDDPTPGPGLAIVKAPPSDMTLEFAAGAFLESRAKRSANSKKLYKRAVDHFKAWALANSLTRLAEIETPHIRSYFAKYDHAWKKSSAQSRLTHLRVFFNWCTRDRRWLQFAPTEARDLTYGKPNGNGSKRLPLAPHEVTKLLAVIEQMPAEDRDQARALVLLMLYTGMRISDATFFERDFISASNTAKYYVIKTRRQIALAPELQSEVLDALAKLPASRVYFFQPDRDDDYRDARHALREGDEFSALIADYESRVAAATNLVKKALKLAGLTGACHRLRDTFAVNCLSQGVDIFWVSQYLGHSDVKITQAHYVKLVEGYAELMSRGTRKLAYVFPKVAA